MKLKDFMAAMSAIESDRKLTKEVVVSALEEALSKAFRKQIEIPDALVRVDINEKSGYMFISSAPLWKLWKMMNWRLLWLMQKH